MRDPLLWTYDAAPHVLRPIAEGRITASWLLQQNDSRLYTKFKSHGMGKGKLLKLQLEDMVKEAPPDDDVQLYLESLDREVNAETWEEFQEIDLGGSFAGVSLYRMASDSGHGDLYRMMYQVLSGETHGEWGSLMSLDLDRCRNPLHGGHRMGAFDLARSPISLNALQMAADLVEGTVVEVFNALGVDPVRPSRSFTTPPRSTVPLGDNPAVVASGTASGCSTQMVG